MTENKRLFVGKKKCEDRFTIINTIGEIGVKENRSGDVIVLKHSDLNAQQFVAQLVAFLNDQNQAIVDLYDGSKYWSDKAVERIKELENENEQLKQFKSVAFEIVDAFIRGIESEKGIDKDNQLFHDKCDFTLKYLERLKEELQDPSEFIRLQKELQS